MFGRIHQGNHLVLDFYFLESFFNFNFFFKLFNKHPQGQGTKGVGRRRSKTAVPQPLPTHPSPPYIFIIQGRGKGQGKYPQWGGDKLGSLCSWDPGSSALREDPSPEYGPIHSQDFGIQRFLLMVSISSLLIGLFMFSSSS